MIKLESLWSWLWVRLATERGQTMAEYGILIAVIALIVIVAAVTLGNSLTGLFNGASRKVRATARAGVSWLSPGHA